MRPVLHILAALLVAGPVKGTESPFAIRVVDDATGRGVPLIELTTTGNLRLVTDSNGIVAFREPGLMGRRVFFHVGGHGYEHPADGFGYRGVALDVVAGGSATVRVRRINVAERLYRVTGAGIYRDSVLVGAPVPIREPLLNAGVIGSDSVISAVFQGRIHWFWGDTNLARYPLGIFHAPGATSRLPGRGGLDPDAGIDLRYFVDDKGIARPTAKFPGEGPTWLSGAVVLRDGEGRERLFAHHVRIRGDGALSWTVTERGLAEFDAESKQFERVAVFEKEEPFPSGGHTFLHEEDGAAHVYYCDPFPLIRVAADPASLRSQASYEAFTPLAAGTLVGEHSVDRAPDGSARWAWKRDTAPVRPVDLPELVRLGVLRESDARFILRDADTGKEVIAHRGTLAWNEHRRRWVMIAGETFGTSMLGETWYAEADRPLGPWAYARKVVTHDRYSFYNPKHHPFLDRDGGRVIYFEGTYTTSFSGNDEKTPRYDYNQIVYRLDLDDARLRLPVAVYERAPGPPDSFVTGGDGTAGLEVAFWALDRERDGAVPVFATRTDRDTGALAVGPRADGDDPRPLFWALPRDADRPPATTTPLFEFAHSDGRRAYATPGRATSLEGFRRSERPLCLVWRHPPRR